VTRSSCAWLVGSWLACAACGPPSLEPPEPLEVGVIPFSDSGRRECPSQYSSVLFDLDNAARGCSLENTFLGEAAWTEPTTVKYPITPEVCTRSADFSVLSFCRVPVEPDLFRPLTTDENASELFYALLQFGKSCPRYSHPIAKYIRNEPENNRNASSGPIEPNESSRLLGNYTKLFFCFFTTAPNEYETMSEFPDLGLPYSVFHDFDVPAPSWVISRRWMFTDDADYGEANAYLPSYDRNPLTRKFAEMTPRSCRPPRPCP
jgi:hypothetical protein